jgi:hypothetical protein
LQYTGADIVRQRLRFDSAFAEAKFNAFSGFSIRLCHSYLPRRLQRVRLMRVIFLP